MAASTQSPERAQQATGIPGLDDILTGGLSANRVYLIEGTPGTGKTTLALQWLFAGIKAGEPGLYMTLAETREELDEVVQSHGWSLEKVAVCEAVVAEQELTAEEQFSVFHPTDVELNESTRQLVEMVEKVKPKRVVIDSLSEMRLLAQNFYRHRQQVIALKRFFQKRGCTVLMLDDRTNSQLDLHLQTACHGIIQLEQMPAEYGTERRRLRVLKMRGRGYALGYHDFIIQRGGLEVFPRVVAREHPPSFESGRLKSGIAELDNLLGGGPRFGTSTLVIGPAGTGKSSLAQQFAVAAANRSEHVAIFTFEESLPTMLARSDGLGLGLRPHIGSGRIKVEQIDPGQLSPGEFAAHVRRAVEHPKDGRTSVVIIDSLNGYMNAMPEERFLLIQLHELVTYLGTHGVVTFLVLAQRGLVGTNTQAPVDTTYLADNTILLRFFEAAGELKVALASAKMRSAPHERTIRELRMGSQGIRIGPPLHQFQGVLTGEPTFVGAAGALIGEKK